MPNYEFKCKNCKKVTEKLYKYKNRPLGIVCPFCGEIANIIMSINNFHLKGGGWYSDGYSKDKK